jgi:hypothetical protein
MDGLAGAMMAGPSPDGHHFASTLMLALAMNVGLKQHLQAGLGVMESVRPLPPFFFFFLSPFRRRKGHQS